MSYQITSLDSAGRVDQRIAGTRFAAATFLLESLDRCPAGANLVIFVNTGEPIEMTPELDAAMVLLAKKEPPE